MKKPPSVAKPSVSDSNESMINRSSTYLDCQHLSTYAKMSRAVQASRQAAFVETAHVRFGLLRAGCLGRGRVKSRT